MPSCLYWEVLLSYLKEIQVKDEISCKKVQIHLFHFFCLEFSLLYSKQDAHYSENLNGLGWFLISEVYKCLLQKTWNMALTEENRHLGRKISPLSFNIIELMYTVISPADQGIGKDIETLHVLAYLFSF